MKVSSKIVRGPIDDLVDRSTGVFLPSYDEVKTVVADYQRMAVRRARHKWAFSDLQNHLLLSMQSEQVHLQALEKSRPADEHRELFEVYKEFAKLPLLALRRVADGMAFRFLNYDMALVQALKHNSVGLENLSSPGMLHELEYAASLADFQPGAQVLLCALSDLLNIGDVIVKTEESFEVVEVKKGKSARGARVSRQKGRLEALADCFRNGGGDVDGIPMRLARMPCRRHRLAELEAALQKCKGASPVLLEISPFQTVWCFDVLSDSGEDFGALLKAAEQDATARFGERWMAFKSFEQRNHVGVTPPVTVFPWSSDLIADVLLGGLVYVSFVSLEALAAHIEQRGWGVVDVLEASVERGVPGFPVFHVFSPENVARNYSVPVDVLIDMGASMIDIDSVLVGSEQITERDGANWTPVYEGECVLWR